MAINLNDVPNGMADITLGDKTVSIDIWKTRDIIQESLKTMPPETTPQTEWLAAIRQVMVELGLPSASDFVVNQFVDSIYKAAEEIEKKVAPPEATDGSSPESLASMVSTLAGSLDTD